MRRLLIALGLAFAIAVIERVVLGYVNVRPSVELTAVLLTFFVVFIIVTRVGGEH